MKRKSSEKSLSNNIFIIFIILLLPTFFVREYRIIKSKKNARILLAEDVVNVTLNPIEDQRFTFIILTQDDAETIERNYESISIQKYHDYNIIYIDKGSRDNTVELLKKKIASDKEAKVIQCAKSHDAYEAYYQEILKCSDSRVIIHLCGSDWLAHEDVLSILSQSYSDPDVWLSYGQHLDYWSFRKGKYNPKPQKNLYKKRTQKVPWLVAPLKSYYAGLFKKLHIDSGFFLSIQDENAFLSLMADLSKAHIRFIPDILFIHYEKRENNKRGSRPAFVSDGLKDAVETKMFNPIVDLILFSKNSPKDLKGCLESSYNYLRGINSIYVIYECNEISYKDYEKLKKTYPNVHFICPTTYKESNFKQAVIGAIWGVNHVSPYVILSTDQMRIHAPVFLWSCVNAMRKTGAYAFYLHLGKKNESRLVEGIYSWNIRQEEMVFHRPDVLKMGLYRRLDLERDFREMSFNSPYDLMNVWVDHAPSYRIGLSFEKPKVSMLEATVTH